MTNDRVKVLRREFHSHFDSRMGTEDVGMGLKHLYMELNILMWVDDDLIEGHLFHNKHTRAGVDWAFGQRLAECRNEGCEEYPGARKDHKWIFLP